MFALTQFLLFSAHNANLRANFKILKIIMYIYDKDFCDVLSENGPHRLIGGGSME